MIKRVCLAILGIFVIIFSLSVTFIPVLGTARVSEKEPQPTTTSEAYIPSELETNFLEYIYTTDLIQLQELMQECLDRQTNAHNMAEAARLCGYAEDHSVILLAKEEYENAQVLYEKYKNDYEELIREFGEEYPVATEVWIYLKNLGYNDYICAGIIGNMMAETTGGTLALRYDVGTSHYGLCQWSTYYYPEMVGSTLEEQLDFLRDTIEYQIDYGGFVYQSDFGYDEFIQLEDEREAALGFAMAYERCAPEHYWVRADFAEIAYNFFVR